MTPNAPGHDETRSIEIPERTAETIAERLPETEFESVDDYVSFALGQILRELHRSEDENETTVSDSDVSGTDSRLTDDLEDRLDSLGYL